ncbi:MAG TPA: PQQ-binding-like beta-propeller repeat protein [Planctomycetota bacterium]|nr:PQQ-binding-like beta-propeller repeat protein [Planctomycetota bacterium]
MSRRICRILATTALLASTFARGENWPQWRGPFFNGSTTETNLPATFSETENVLWTTPLPGSSGATPIVWGGRIFLPSVDASTGDLLALCVDAKTGKVLWRNKTGKDRPGPRNNMASPSAVTDGKSVWFYYGTASLFAFDFEGKELWTRDLEKDHGHNALMFGYSSSPLLYQGRLYIVAIRSKRQDAYRAAPPSKEVSGSYLLAIDPATGKDLWKHVRATDAVGEAQESYSTAIPREVGGRAEILVYGADYMTAHDPATGKELWRWGGYNPKKTNHWRTVPSPVVADDIVIAVGPKFSTLFALRPKGEGRLGDDIVAWRFEKRTPDASTPLFYKGRLYFLDDDRRVITCVDPKTGEQKWQGELAGRAVIRAAITGADDKLYTISELREATVLAAGDEFRILHTTKLGATGRAFTRSSIVAAGGRLLVRTGENLYCIARAQER